MKKFTDENTRPRPLYCPVCGNKLRVTKDKTGCFYAICRSCVFEFSRSYPTRKELVQALENAKRSNK